MPILSEFKSKHADVKSPIDSWVQEVKAAQWQNTHDVKARYSSADFFKGNRVVINLKGNKYRLLFRVNYQVKVVQVEKVGTHNEYNKWNLN